MYRVALIRSASSKVSKNQYNVQEIGLAKILTELGMIVDIFLISDTNETYFEKCGKNDNATIYWLKGIKIPGQQGYYKDLIPILKKNKYDVIEALDDSQITTVLVSNYCKKNGIKFILWQGMYENYPETYKRVIQFFYDLLILPVLRKNTKYCIAKTNSAKKYLLSKKFKNITVIPVGLETSNFQKNKDIDYREKLNIPKNHKILLYIGKVEERRKPIFCMKLYKKIKDEYKNTSLVYVGSGPMLEETKEYAKSLKLKDIHFIEKLPQSELQSLYKESSLFILPTRYEIFGMVLLESMYFGTPVITYKAAGPLDVIENEKDGIVMDNFEIENWFNKVKELIYEKDLSNTMGKKAQEKIKSNYLWKDIGKRYYKEFEKIISKN